MCEWPHVILLHVTDQEPRWERDGAIYDPILWPGRLKISRAGIRYQLHAAKGRKLAPHTAIIP
jgi:hypothetical protein